MAGRPRSFDQDWALDQLVDVFWTHGYDATSVDDLQDAIGIKRGSFYAAFGDKEAAFKSALQRYVMRVTTTRLLPETAVEDPYQRLIKMLQGIGHFLAENPGRGCLLMSTVAEPPMHAPSIGADVQRMSESLSGPLADAARQLAENGQLPADVTPEALSAYFLSQVLGLNALARISDDGAPVEAAAEVATRSLRQLLTH